MNVDLVDERPYRSKMKRPCDRCRSRKIACILHGSGPCQSCWNAGKDCVFDLPPIRRRNNHLVRANTTSVGSSAEYNIQINRNEGLEQSRPSPHFQRQSHTQNDGPNNNGSQDVSVPRMGSQGRPDDFLSMPTTRRQSSHSEYLLQEIDRDAPVVQHIRSLDQLEASTAQLFGTSAESDPWLLRHCKYDENGIRSLNRIQFRNVGGVPVEGLVPVHFLVTEDTLWKSAKKATAIRADTTPEEMRIELDDLVPPKCGWRLISFRVQRFMKFIFPSMPIVSRSEFRLLNQSLQNVPVHLLAAIYATALPFKNHDPALVIFGVYDESLGDRIWRIVYELLMQEIHTPHLSVIQACLLYLQRLPTGSQSALADSPLIWSFLGSAVALAHSLGLHLEPSPWGIPSWEKRLRRRLWWAVYLEDKWRSLLIGRPPFIHPEDWDVKDLNDTDFIVDELEEISAGELHAILPAESEYGLIFRSFIKLAQVADRIHQTFYTLKRSQTMSEDFLASINAARPIREELQTWYRTLPQSLRMNHIHEKGSKSREDDLQSIEGVCALHFAYLTLELFVYRAILRPLARSPPPPPIVADDKNSQTMMWLLEDLGIDGYGLDPFLSVDISEFGDAAEATLNAAQKCAGIIVNFVGALSSSDLDTFWYPWSRICFATVSNYITLLLIQAPTGHHASRAKYLLDSWSLNLGRQYNHNQPLLSLGLVRLRTFLNEGLGRTFIMPPHVTSVLNTNPHDEYPSV
ncbi:fungal-specific transcription factor domain-containing protein [Talaromyces proteolyticus]|uniref:Fungal-specific transcription factor domain-containing protein n=1 Tax=Talaromyces proteolyticus TaxID=1131652 RepID=A0AAD4KXY2_9EURO|nr:fungal-specific transcription factor domain-containing protein [Talaromyces proteolyticus]KAH8701582.1 fungal-specific transcription factor domain-containing protein [Talaromyces proteolyticus]